MDANGTRFHLLLGQEDWGACRDGSITGPTLASCWEGRDEPNARVEWDAQRVELRLASRAFLFAHSVGDTPPRLRDRRGAARDLFGNWYWIAPNGREILVHSAGSRETTHFWSSSHLGPVTLTRPAGGFAPDLPPRPVAPQRLSGLAITEDHHLVAGTLDLPGLLVFDLHGGGPPSLLKWPEGWLPFDFSPRVGGGLWVLERDLGDPNAESWIWEIDRQFRVLRPATAEAAGHAATRLGGFEPGPLHIEARHRHREVSRDDARRHRGVGPVTIEGLRDGTALVVDSPPGTRFSTVWRYGDDATASLQLGADDDLDANVRPEDRATFRMHAADAAVVPGHSGDGERATTVDRLYLVGDQGNQVFEFDLHLARDSFRLALNNRYLPMRLFGGMGLVATTDELPSYDLGNRWVPLVEQRRRLYEAAATLVTPVGPPADRGGTQRPAFDGRVPDCTWHRLMLDACIPPGTAVSVESQAVNDLVDLRENAWQHEPTPYLRGPGSEIPFQPRRTAAGDGTWELLFQKARGRFLVLRLTLHGTGTSTPRIRALRAYFPRFSYLEHYLPDVYRDDVEAAHFLDRYLANLEGIATGIEDRIAQVQALLDVHSAPADVLPWLASWFGLVLDPAWDEARRRVLIEHAMDFFAWRGTIHGLEMALRLALDPCVDASIFHSPQRDEDGGSGGRPGGFRIHETFLRRHGGEADLGDGSSGASGVSTVVPDAGTTGRWQMFLKRRYRRVDAVNRAHRYYGAAAKTSFGEIPLPETTSPGEPIHEDWRQFRELVLGAGALAHRFTVLLPGRNESAEEQQARAALVSRVIDLEKPAHTVFDVRFYWSAFRIGQARLGDDTIVDLGARSMFAMPPLVLSRGGLAQGYLTSRNPLADAHDRRTAGHGNLGG